MEIEFWGATRTVTGSQFIISDGKRKILFECGLFQGRRKESEERNRNFPYDPGEIPYLFLSHAHMDHAGNIPNLVKHGFRGKIIATPATIDLLQYMLRDSAHIHEKDAEYVNKKRKRKGLPPIEPLYTMKDAEESMEFFEPLDYYETFEDGFSVRFIEAGHILGSVQLIIEMDGKKIGFTGDLGRPHLPILRDPDQIEGVDVLIMESTYGKRYHRPIEEAYKDLEKIIKRAEELKGKVIIPAFSVGRTQEVVYCIHRLIDEKRIPEIPVYVDSPLSTNVTEVFRRHPECFDEETYKMFLEEGDPFGFERIEYIRDVEESKALNHMHGPMVIISASGMCEHGRILHHLKNSIEDERNAVVIVGYQAVNTLGRKLVEGEKRVNIFGEPYTVRAPVYVLNEFSAHADRNDLLRYVESSGVKRIILVHGEEKEIEALREELARRGYDVHAPRRGERITI